EVKAQKHVQAIEDIAVSLSVVDSKTIIEQNIKATTALAQQSPNLKITQNSGEGTPPSITIRGVGSFDFNTSTSSPVGIFLDEVAGGAANSQLINLFDIESIEILRGPQSTLFGRNTNAGAILIRSQRPQDQFGGYIVAGIAEQNHKKLEGAVNLPVNDNVATRVAFTRHDYQYSTVNLHPGAPVAGMRQDMLRLSVAGKWDKLDVYAKVHGEKWDGIVQPPGNIGVVKSIDPATGERTLCTPAEAGSSLCTDGFGFNDGSDNFREVRVNNEVYGNSPHLTDSWGTDVHLSYQINDNYHFETITSFNTLDRTHHFNCDYSSNSICEGAFGVESDTVTQEIRLHAQLDKLYVIGGLYYLDEAITQHNFADLFRDFRSSEAAFGSASRFAWNNRIFTTAFAAFVHAERQLTDNTQLSAGLRYSNDETDYHALSTINLAAAQNDQIGFDVPGWDLNGNVQDDNLSGKLALLHQFSDRVSGFASYSRGFKSGGYNGANIFSEEAARRNSYGPETLDAFELALRLNWDDRKARLNLATFYYDYEDQQIFMNQPSDTDGAPPLLLLDNVGKSVIYGFEADFNWQLTPSFKIEFAVGHLPSANLDQFVNDRAEV
ncbi:MAG: TonB-dependent receptor, partial [Psychrosphaera sp.]|nr:TonB-dependent receptor [Psychrosphaera sp.]